MADPLQKTACKSAEVQLRPFPYPYRCMLTICSDLDGTPDKQLYSTILRFLNTTQTTPMGPGVGLEVGNSIHFRAKPQRFSYWDTDDIGREMVRALIHSGHIECLHSFGELVHTRDEVKRALAEFQEHNCRLEVWVDHGGAATNFGSDIMQGHGDLPGHPAYHADLTVDYGIRYICCGRVTSVVGQDVPATLSGIFRWGHPVYSGKTVLKEAVKHGLALAGNAKYAMHRANETMRPTYLRDGRLVYEFMRCNPYWRGVGRGDQGRYLGDVLTRDMLDRLIAREGTCILYTHLGRVDDPSMPFNPRAVSALRRLAQEFHDGKILVTTTRRLLGYRRASREIAFTARMNGDTLHLAVTTQTPRSWVGRLPLSDLSGLTFYVPDPCRTCMTIDGQTVNSLQVNPPDHTGMPSVSLPWTRLVFPRIA